MNKFNWSKREWILGGCAAGFLLLLMIHYLHPFSGKDQSDAMTWNEVSETDKPDPTIEKKTTEKPEQPKAVVVDVKGAVNSPGVYEMKDGSRVIDVIGKAGGLSAQADYKRINQAQLLKDEMVIYVPKKGEKVKDLPAAVSGAAGETTGTSSEEGKIAINSADENELQKLTGIGPAKAKAILSYREEHGPFQKVEDLLEISGIGEKTLEKIKEQVSLE